MRMKLRSTAIAAAAFMAIGTSANAITVMNSPYITYAQDVAAFGVGGLICDFDSPCTGGNTFTFSGGQAPGSGIMIGTTPGVSEAPPGDPTNYASVLGPNGIGTLNLVAGFTGISFFMGSPDTYNTVTFFNGAANVGSFTGASFTGPPADGDPSLGERISFDFEGATVTRVEFSSTQNSFEFDRIGVGGTQFSAVPEPATWALMIIGFGGAGAMIRRRRALAAAA